MTDYFTLLSRAVASLDRNTKESREALYARARSVLLEQLRAADPPWPDAQIKSVTASLDSAIRQVEFEARHSAAQGGRQIAAAPRPPVSQIDAAERVDADTPLPRQRMRGSVSPTLLGGIGAIVLALIAAGGYAYLSRPATKPLATAASTGTTPVEKPVVRRPPPSQRRARAEQGKPDETADSNLAYGLRRQLVYYRSSYAPGTIVIVKSQHMLYQVRAETVALRYSIAIGPKCQDAVGLHRVLGKDTTPVWPPAPSGSEHRADSRLGSRVLYLSDIDYGIHGTDKPSAIGQDAAFGCFLLTADDIGDLYERTPVDTRVVITN